MPSSTSNETALDPLARKQRILDHLELSRRARQSSHIDDKTAAAQARIQRRLAARRRDIAATQALGLEAARLAEADRGTRPAAGDAQRILQGSEASGEPASAQDWRDSMAELRQANLRGSRFTAPDPEATVQIAAVRRNIGTQPPAATFASPEQNDLARLQAKAKAEKQRAEFLTALLEDVLSASTARIIKHQARLEAIQAQINALQGR